MYRSRALKVLVVGTGSIGIRHINNLLYLGAEVIAYSHTRNPLTLNSLDRRVEVVDDWKCAIGRDIDAVVVANNSDQHVNVAIAAARRGKAIFIEKPISVSLRGVDELSNLIEVNNLVVETGFMLRCHPNLIWIKNAVQSKMLGDLLYLRASVGQWLPDWRPGTDYRMSYSASRERGGGVIFDLIHELDLIEWIAGEIVDSSAMTRMVPMLGIKTEAIAEINLSLASGIIANVHVDYVRPRYHRSLEIAGEKAFLTWDCSSGTVNIISRGESVRLAHTLDPDYERNVMFVAHMKHFLRRIAEPSVRPISSFSQGLRALRVALASHKSAMERCNVRPDEVESNFQV